MPLLSIFTVPLALMQWTPFANQQADAACNRHIMRGFQ